MTLTPQSGKRGVTILELLVVTVILLALAALLFPALRGMADRAKAVNCAAAIRQFGAAVLAFRGEHNGYLPPGELIAPLTADNQNPQAGVDIKKQLIEGGYLKELPYCPSMRLSAEGKRKLKKGETEMGRIKEMGSYAINMFLTQTKPEGLPGPYWGGYPYPGHHKMMFIAEAYYCGLTWSFSQQNFALDGADFGGLYVAPRDHGNHRLSFMFLDGHVELIAPKVKGTGDYDWTEAFDSWGRDGRFVGGRRARE